MPAPAAFVLDFNGTISDDEPLLEEIYRALFAGIGLDLSPARYHAELAGLSDPAIIAAGIALAGRAGEAGLAGPARGRAHGSLPRGRPRDVPHHRGRRGVRASCGRTRPGRHRIGRCA